ncbi:hypothetical protein PoB_003183800 [Plakobranchus ocellatus]|uniref:Uncharacterized protein n=1 Tax=Plakobranchus ocellatus TaxID=259542 RepID=A0AAV4ADM1_9GAST|nr:hypothetical protein PoB_003183800 [Plakobranchus ocellatus]
MNSVCHILLFSLHNYDGMAVFIPFLKQRNKVTMEFCVMGLSPRPRRPALVRQGPPSLRSRCIPNEIKVHGHDDDDDDDDNDDDDDDLSSLAKF